jgi:hypothetical protein
MSEPITKAEVRPLNAPGAPVEPPTFARATNLLEKALALPVGVARMSRDEVFRAVYAGIDWVEGLNQSSFKIVREAVRQVDQLSRLAMDDVDSLVGTFAKAVRGSGETAGELVSKTAVSLMGAKPTA